MADPTSEHSASARSIDTAADTGAVVPEGWIALPSFVEPHAHLDKAFLAERIDNPTGDLMGAIVAMESNRHLITHADTVERATRAARLMASNGVTAVRTHADVTAETGLLSVEALVEVREALRDEISIQIVALSGWPSVGPAGADQRALLREAIARGVDVVGGCPHLEPDAAAANEWFLTIAAEHGLPVDLHTDETLDPTRLSLDDLARRVISSGFANGVTASHCVSLGMQPEHVQRSVAELVAEAGIAVIVLPQTNLFLQGRDHPTATPRGLTAVNALRAAGVVVAAGGDNLQDPFNPLGRADPLETAALLVLTAHLSPADALDAVAGQARRAIGAPAGGAEVLVRATTVRDALAWLPAERIVRTRSVDPFTEPTHGGNAAPRRVPYLQGE